MNDMAVHGADEPVHLRFANFQQWYLSLERGRSCMQSTGRTMTIPREYPLEVLGVFGLQPRGGLDRTSSASFGMTTARTVFNSPCEVHLMTRIVVRTAPFLAGVKVALLRCLALPFWITTRRWKAL